MSSYFDSYASCLKTLLILLVIWGHIFSQIPISYEHSALNLALYDTIYCFHMPLFVFISGWFTRKRTMSMGLKKNLKIVWIYVLSQLLYTTTTNGWNNILSPYPSLWYLIALFVYRTLIDLIPHNALNKFYLLLPIAFILATFVGFTVYSSYFEMMKIISFFPYFLFGYYSHIRYQNIKNLPKINKYLAFVIIIIAITVIYIYGKPLLWLTHRNIPYAYTNLSIKDFLIYKCLLFVFTILLSYSFIAVCFKNNFLEKEGKNTLLYYIYHFPIIQFILAPLFLKYQYHPKAITTLLIAIIIFAFLRVSVCKYSLFQKILDPMSKN